MPNDRENWRGYEWTALSVTTVGALLASIQGSALLIALPDIMTELHAGFMTIMWVILGFMLITTALVPIVGRLADMFGRKNLYNAGFAVFTLGSLLCGFSSPQFQGWDLVLYRMIQGIGGALLFVLIFFLQGPYGLDPLWAGIMMAPFGAAFMFVGPISGYLSDRYGSRGLATVGLLISGLGLLGLATVVSSTPYWLLAIYQALMGSIICS